MAEMAMQLYETTRLEADNALSANPMIQSKYRMAAEIASQTLRHVCAQVRVGASAATLCESGDAFILHQQKCEKGVAMPTCVNINDIVAHFAPEQGSMDVTLAHGDLIKIELGVHIDGYIAVVAHSMIVSALPATAPVEGPSADCVCAAYYASQVVLRMMRPGMTSDVLLQAVRRVASAFHVSVVEGPVVTEMKRFVAAYPGKVLEHSAEDPNGHSFPIDADEVYAVNIAMTDSESTTREASIKPTILQRNVSKFYNLRLTASRAVFADICDQYGVFPFNTRLIGEGKKRMGLQECMQYNLLDVLPVEHVKRGSMVAQFKMSVSVQPEFTTQLTNPDLALPYVHSRYALPADLAALVALPLGGGQIKCVKPPKSIEEQLVDEAMMDMD